MSSSHHPPAVLRLCANRALTARCGATGVIDPCHWPPGWKVRDGHSAPVIAGLGCDRALCRCPCSLDPPCHNSRRSEEHTSELQSRGHIVCRLLLEKNK